MKFFAVLLFALTTQAFAEVPVDICAPKSLQGKVEIISNSVSSSCDDIEQFVSGMQSADRFTQIIIELKHQMTIVNKIIASSKKVAIDPATVGAQLQVYTRDDGEDLYFAIKMDDKEEYFAIKEDSVLKTELNKLNNKIAAKNKLKEILK